MQDKITLEVWQENMMEEVEGTVFISCIMQEVPHHPRTKRFHVYNEEGTFNKDYDITTDSNGYITSIE